MSNSGEVILVNELDEPLGSMEKIEAHRKALLHRAFSVFIFNNKGEMTRLKKQCHPLSYFCLLRNMYYMTGD